MYTIVFYSVVGMIIIQRILIPMKWIIVQMVLQQYMHMQDQTENYHLYVCFHHNGCKMLRCAEKLSQSGL